MDSESFEIFSTDKKYFFRESKTHETDGHNSFIGYDGGVFHHSTELEFSLGFDPDPRWWLMPIQLYNWNYNSIKTEN